MHIMNVTLDNIHEIGVFCGKEEKFTSGRSQKIAWLKKRFEDGLMMKIAVDDDGVQTGMIEYLPGEYAWRTIHAPGYTVIHCLQVFRSQTRKGYGKALLHACLNDAALTNGVVILTSNKPWVNDKKFFLKNGFRQIEKAPPYFELLVNPFKDVVLPTFHTGWENRAAHYGQGITVLYSHQCPIIASAINNIQEAAKTCKKDLQCIQVDDYQSAQNAPSPYATFMILKDGKFLTHRIYDTASYVSLIRG